MVNASLGFVKEMPESWRFGRLGGNLPPRRVSTKASFYLTGGKDI
jgi:hypothetical protein